IGLFLAAGTDAKRPGLKQAEEAWLQLTALDHEDARAHGWLNLARAYVLEGNLSKAVEALEKVRGLSAPWWTVAWFTGLVNAQNGYLDEAVANFEKILDPKRQPRERKFDFTQDYVVLNELGTTLFKRAQQEFGDRAERDRFLKRAAGQYERTLKLDAEDLDAHYGLAQCYKQLGEEAPAGVVIEGPA